MGTYPADEKSQLDQTLQILNAPDAFPAESLPAQVEFDGPLRFRFPTPRPCACPENNVVYGRLYRRAGRWQERPTIILLHGGCDFPSHYFRFPLVARQGNRAGFNVATLELPYHFQRRPRQRGAWRDIDDLRFAELMTQAVAEVRALTGWLLSKGCAAVSLCGGSLGSWIAGLTACRDARLASVAMVLPAVCARQLFAVNQHIFSQRIREKRLLQQVAREALDTTPINLLSSKPVISTENILLVAGIHDLICGRKFVEELWQTWSQPEIWRLPHGHVSAGVLGVSGLTNRILRWLAPRLNVPAVRIGQTAIPQATNV